MFLLLCVPQLLDWQIQRGQGRTSPGIAELTLLVTVLAVLWSNGNAKGHETFLLLPQLLNWLLFFCLAVVLMLNLLQTCAGVKFAHRLIRR
jgi:hypothetical protein